MARVTRAEREVGAAGLRAAREALVESSRVRVVPAPREDEPYDWAARERDRDPGFRRDIDG